MGLSSSFKRRVGFVIATLVVTLAIFGLLLTTIQVALLAFAAILGGLVLATPTSWLAARSRFIPRPLALVLVVLALLGATAGIGVLVGSTLSKQFEQLAREVPAMVRSIVEQGQSLPVVQELISALPAPEQMLSGSGSGLAANVASVFSGVGDVLVAIAFIAVVSLFFAVQPARYVDPLVRLVPPDHRDQARHLIGELSTNLRAWLVARFVSMLAVAVLTGLGLWLVGIPAWASLAVLAGVLSFVPNLGPILAAIPGILLGLTQDPMTALWAALVYIVVQLIEGNFITPFAEQRAVAIPAAYLLTIQLLMGITTGVLGLMVATPLLVVVVVTVRELYVEHIEGGPRSVALPAEGRRLAS